VLVRETFEGKTVYVGVVHVFDLTGHPTATSAYACSSPIAPEWFGAQCGAQPTPLSTGATLRQ